MLAGEHFAGTAESCGHFIGNEEDIIFSTEIPNPLQIARRGGQHACCRLHEWLDDETGKFMVPIFEDLLNRVEAGHLARWKGQTERAAIAIGWVCFGCGEEQRLKPPMEKVDVADTYGPDRIAMVGQLQV